MLMIARAELHGGRRFSPAWTGISCLLADNAAGGEGRRPNGCVALFFTSVRARAFGGTTGALRSAPTRRAGAHLRYVEVNATHTL